MNKFLRVLKNPRIILLKLIRSRFFSFLSDEQFTKLEYFLIFDRKLDLENPQRYNDKLHWIKLYATPTEYSKLVDKYDVREFVKETIGEEYLIKNFGVYEKFEEIDFNKLPDEFIIKPTHTSGNVLIVPNKAELNLNDVRRNITKWLKRNYYFEHREVVYKNIKPRIIIEELLKPENGEKSIRDYKFFCFDGNPEFLFVASDRPTETKFDFFDLEFNKLQFRQHYPNSNKVIEKPINLNKMIELSKILSKNFKHVRVDFYEIGNKIYFGELTFFHFAGIVPFDPDIIDFKIGELIQLDK